VSDDQVKRFEAAGWNAARIDGHDGAAIDTALRRARGSDRPTMIACKTLIGYGAPTKQGKAASHGEPLGPEEIKGARERLGWTSPPFEVPADVFAAWRAAGARGRPERAAWEQRAAKLEVRTRAALVGPIDDTAARGMTAALDEIASEFQAAAPKIATRAASQRVLEKLVPVLPGLIGGSADLTGSNGTKTARHTAVAAHAFAGNYIHYGVREHAMAAAMTGLSLHGGVLPYGGTFLAFSDYCRPAIRLAALMGRRVIYVMTHDSIGVGEDGPTHQPVEHLAALRAIPNLNVFRPADAIEVAECWELALQSPRTPSVLALTRQAVPPLARTGAVRGACARGGYVVSGAEGERRDVTLMATGSEVFLAMEAKQRLGEAGLRAAVVSLPCFELFAAQDARYRAQVLGSAPRVGIEAAVRQGWERWLGDGGAFIGMDGFGASAPVAKLYEHFAITADRIVETAKREAVRR
jgi:transketolase